MRRFFYQQNTHTLAQQTDGGAFELSDDIFHHWCRVLRARVGDEAQLFDGHGGEYQVTLTDISKTTAHAKIVAFNAIERTPKFRTMIGLVMSRGDRMDYAIQKATELGVTGIQLLSSHHGEVHLKPAQVDKKLQHWQQVALSAAEQCGLNRPPLLFAPMPITDWLSYQIGGNTASSLRINQINPTVRNLIENDFYQHLTQHIPDVSLVLAVPSATQEASAQVTGKTISDKTHENPHDSSKPKSNTQAVLQACLKLLCESTITQDSSENKLQKNAPYFHLLVGPEGGLSDDELSLALSSGYLPWQMGNRVLRTETAPVVALATLQALSSLSEYENRHDKL